MLNIVALEGRLVADPELAHTNSGVNVCRLRLAVERSYVAQGQERQADFIDVVAWRQTAEFACRYFQKGQLICVDGALQTRSYQDRDGNKRTAVEVVAQHLHFCGSNRNAQAAGSAPRPAGSVPAAPASGMDDFAELDDTDDLPF